MSERIDQLPAAVLPLGGTELTALFQNSATVNAPVSSLAGAGTEHIIQSTVLTGVQSSLVFTFPTGFTNARIQLIGRSNAVGLENVALLLNFNGDSGANYDYETLISAGAVATASASLGQVNMGVSSFNGATATANYPSQVNIVISNYPDTTFYQGVFSFGSYRASTSAASIYVAGIWKMTQAVVTATLTLGGAGQFIVGTKATLSVQ